MRLNIRLNARTQGIFAVGLRRRRRVLLSKKSRNTSHRALQGPCQKNGLWWKVDGSPILPFLPDEFFAPCLRDIACCVFYFAGASHVVSLPLNIKKKRNKVCSCWRFELCSMRFLELESFKRCDTFCSRRKHNSLEVCCTWFQPSLQQAYGVDLMESIGY